MEKNIPVEKNGDCLMTLTKDKLSTAVQTALDISKVDSGRLTETFFEIIKNTLEAGEEVLISGFGKFYILDKRARKGRNPQTGEDFTITARRVLTFKASGVLKNRINGGREINLVNLSPEVH
jgi:integration host factor subunit alpha